MVFWGDFEKSWVWGMRWDAGFQEDWGIVGVLGSRMGFLVSGSEFFGGEVGIDLGGGKVRVS